MDPRISPVMAAVLIAPFALALFAAVMIDLSQSRRDRIDGIVATWADLRITQSFLVVGYHRSARRIPLDGLEVTVTTAGAPGDAPGTYRAILTVTGAEGEPIERSQPGSTGAITTAQMFAILVNRASRRHAPAVTPVTPVTVVADLPRAAVIADLPRAA